MVYTIHSRIPVVDLVVYDHGNTTCCSLDIVRHTSLRFSYIVDADRRHGYWLRHRMDFVAKCIDTDPPDFYTIDSPDTCDVDLTRKTDYFA